MRHRPAVNMRNYTYAHRHHLGNHRRILTHDRRDPRAHHPLAAATHRRRQGTGNAGMVLVMGAILDGIPEQTVLGVGMGAGNDVSIALLIAICLANIPESVGSASDMKSAGVPTRRIMGNCVAT